MIHRNPEAIVIVDAYCYPAKEKIALLKSTPAYADLQAVRKERFVVIPFSNSTPGIRMIQAVEELARKLYPDRFK
ncbi:hypothetical protein L0222_24995 [bacterium]|nr:hypothetical protein [bacterium]MCI0619299.1 hypothetical protein [bacterium]